MQTERSSSCTGADSVPLCPVSVAIGLSRSAHTANLYLYVDSILYIVPVYADTAPLDSEQATVDGFIQDGLPACRWLPASVLTGFDVEQLCCLRLTCSH